MALNDMASRLGLGLSVVLLAFGCAHSPMAEPPVSAAVPDSGPAPLGWRSGSPVPPRVLTRSSMLDEENGLVHIVTTSGEPWSRKVHVDVLRVGDGRVAWSMEGQPLWVGSLEGRTRAFALSPERGAVVELDPKSGQTLRSWAGGGGVLPGLSRVEGGALLVELAIPYTDDPNGAPPAGPRPPPPEPRRMFVPLDREGPVSFHQGALPASGAAAPALPEVITEGQKLWLRPAGDTAPVLLIDPAPPEGSVMVGLIDTREVVLIVNATTGKTVWQLHDAATGALRARVPSDRCRDVPRLVGEVIVCEREVDASSRREIVAMDARTLEPRWTHAATSLPMPSPHAAAPR